jgi:epoxyqueuosine reductase
MNKNGAKEDYNQDFKEFVSHLDLSHGKPTLFLHACCGPCLTYPLTLLSKYFKITVGYINPNIYPAREHQKRLDELERFVEGFNKEYKEEIQVVAYPYDYQRYLEAIKGHETDREGGERCTLCHHLRLDLAYKYAFEHGYSYFATVMTVSSKKPSALLNEICFGLQKKYPSTVYVPSDFRKENGQLEGIRIAKRYNLYRQNYCGCSFSKEEREEKDLSKTLVS